jgi:2-oxoglutarate dehydrogenase E1 component
MYNVIRQHPSVVKQYGQQLTKEGVIDEATIKSIADAKDKHFDEELKAAKVPVANHLTGKWKGFVQATDMKQQIDTGVDIEHLRKIAQASVTVPNDFVSF